MAGVPWHERVVEVIAYLGSASQDRYRYGSGCIVTGRTVLTAAHVVAGAVAVEVRGPDKVARPAAADGAFVGFDEGGQGPDLALIEITDTNAVGLPAMPLAAVDRDRETPAVVEGCHATGYPWFAEQPSAAACSDVDSVRDTLDAVGDIAVASKLVSGLLSLTVSNAPRELPPVDKTLTESPWSGMSGAPVVVDGCVLGVVSAHAPREGAASITVVPLTALEADPGCPERRRGVTNPADWWQRLGGSGVDGLRRLPPRDERQPPAYAATVREIRARTGQLVGRAEELASLVAFATSDESYRWLVGGAWAGKTALLAEAAVAVLPEHVDVVSYFLQRRAADADRARFMAAVVPQLAYLLGEDAPVVDGHQLNYLWERAAARAAETHRHLLLIVDGLDEDIGPPQLPSVAAWLPATRRKYAHVLVASRPYPGVPDDVPIGHPLRTTTRLDLQPFTDHEQLAKLARQELADLLSRDEDGLTARVLGLLAFAEGPLSVSDLATLSSSGTATPNDHRIWRVRRLVMDEAARSIQPIGPPERRQYQFTHDSLLQLARTHERLQDIDYRQVIHDWADSWREAGWPVGSETAPPRYLVGSYASSLHTEPERQAQLVTDLRWIVAAIQVVGVDSVLAQLRSAELAAPTDHNVAAMAGVVRRQVHVLRVPSAGTKPKEVSRRLAAQAAALAFPRVTTSNILVFLIALFTAGLISGVWLHDVLLSNILSREALSLSVAALTVMLTVSMLYAYIWIRERRHRSMPVANLVQNRVAALAADLRLYRLPKLRLDWTLRGRHYGAPGEYRLFLPQSYLVHLFTQRSTFDTFVRHELAHFRNGDVFASSLAALVWHSLVPLFVVLVVLHILAGDASLLPSYVWRAVLLAAVIHLVSSSLLRSREYDADLCAAYAPNDVQEVDVEEVDVGEVPASQQPTAANARDDLEIILRAGNKAQPDIRWPTVLTRRPSLAGRLAVLEQPHIAARIRFLDAFTPTFLTVLSIPLSIRALLTLMTGSERFDPAVLIAVVAGLVMACLVGMGLWRASLVYRANGHFHLPVAAALGVAAGLALGSTASPAHTELGRALVVERPVLLVVSAALGFGATMLVAGVGELWAATSALIRNRRVSVLMAILVNAVVFTAVFHWMARNLESTLRVGS